MFEINGVLSEKFHPQGQIIRMKNSFKMHLNSDKGVVRFLREQRPFAALSIKEVGTDEDKTEYFLKLVKEADERQDGEAA